MRWFLIGLAAVFLLLVLFHGPILRPVVHAVAVKVAAGQNLKLAFGIEGDPLDKLELHNLHATATGPSAVQSLDADHVIVDYSLGDLVFHGISDALKNVELHNVTAVIDSSKAPLPTPTPPPRNEKVSLPAFFPERLEASNINLTMRGEKEDMVVKDFDIGLYPDRAGKLSIDKVQIPGVHTWTGITGTTTYANKNLYIHNLRLDENNQLETVNLDASKIGQGKLGLEVKGSLGGGDITSRMELSAAGTSYGTNTQLQAKDISLGKLAQYLGQPPGETAGEVKNAAIDWHGALDQPATWNGTIKAEIENLRQGKLALGDLKLDVTAANGTATVHEARIDEGNNHVQLRGSIDLPKTTEGFGRTPGNFQFSINAPNLQELTESMQPPVTGSLQANGNLKTGNDTIQLDLSATGDLIGFDKVAINHLSATISAARKLPPSQTGKEGPEANAPFYQNLTASAHLEMSDVRYDDYVVDRVAADVKSNGATVALSPLTVARNNNLLRTTGTFQLPGPNEELIDQPADLQFTLGAPQLSDYWQSDAPRNVTGELQANGSVRSRKGKASGQINLYGKEIAANKLVVRQFSLQTTIADNIVYLNDLTARLNEQDFINAQATVKLEKPFAYTGAATANLADLSTFEPLLNGEAPGEPASPIAATTDGKKTQLAGSLVVNWQGQGEINTSQNRGDLKLKLEQGRYADLQNLQANIEAHYTPQELNVPIIYLGSDKLSFQAILQAKDSRLEISKIQIDQGTAKYASAYASLPFNWNNVGTEKPLFSPNGNVTVHFHSENLDLAKLFKDLGQEPPVAGQLNVKLDAQGPLDQLQASLDLRLQNVSAEAAAQLKPAEIDLGLRLQNNQLRLEGKVQQPLIQPVTLAAQMPFNVSQVIANQKLDEQTPINGKIEMSRSSINFAREFVPALRQLDGSMAINVNLGGTVANPALSGAADMNIVVARFENPTLPALSNFKAQLNFRENVLRLDRFGGDMAGGPFTLSGQIRFPKLTEPTFDLHLKANSVLVARNDNLTARVDADLQVEGPLNAATVRGEVLTTNSRFFKNIDIIPIALPGRPAPHPEPPSAAPTLSFPNPPLRDWKFDIVIKSKDPFLIRGNLATGAAIIDMRMTGTGLHPELQGQVRLQNFDATLPFSTLTINLGFLYFDPDDPLNPRIELQGTSLIRDYTIHVYIYGTAQNPQAVFSSEPPLPQEEIISLLATGTTRDELATGNVLASRAAILLLKQLYRKVFKKGDQPERNDSIFNRLDVEFGNTDPRTGEQTATARYKVNDHVVLIGDLGVQGGFRGLVKYLIRFR